MYECDGEGCDAFFPTPRALNVHYLSCRRHRQKAKYASEVTRRHFQNRRRARISGNCTRFEDTTRDDAPTEEHPAELPVIVEARAPSVEPTPVLSAAGRPVRPRILPARYRQLSPPRNNRIPDPETTLDESGVLNHDGVDEQAVHGSATPMRFDVFRTEADNFGMYKVFRRLRDDNETRNAVTLPPDNGDEGNPYYPLPNFSTYSILRWFWSVNATKSFKDFKHLQNVVNDPRFSIDDFRDANLHDLNKRLGSISLEDDGWIRSSVSISVPLGSFGPNAPNHAMYEVQGFMYRPLVGTIRSILDSVASAKFCYEPYEMRYTPSGSDANMRVHGEMFWSTAFRDAYDEVLRLPRPEDDKLTRTMIALLLYSDSMMASKFGDAKLWPVYLQVGNQSKRERCRAGSGATHLIALFPSLPKEFKTFVTRMTRGRKVTQDLITHCRRELVQACWRIILDDDFVQAWTQGVVQFCKDAVRRRWFPRILAYGADLPEKFLISSQKVLGRYPCPRCRVPAKEILARLGRKRDMAFRRKNRRVDDDDRRYRVATARRFVYEQRYGLNSTAVKQQLDEKSLTPTQNAFSDRLARLGFDVHKTLAVDILHEWEVGIWRTIFTHLVRILATYKDYDRVHALNERVRMTPGFGEAIRTYSGDISEMKQMAGYNFEDLLQCAFAAFDGLLDAPHDANVLSLIYHTATLHALCKLRIHTDATVAALHKETERFSNSLRRFESVTCKQFATTELKSEANKRIRRRARKKTTISEGQANESHVDQSTSRVDVVPKVFNANTAKIHSIGYYAPFILLLGSTESYSTSICESEHKFTRNLYLRTNRVNFHNQVAQNHSRVEHLKRLGDDLEERTQRDADDHGDRLPPSSDHNEASVEAYGQFYADTRFRISTKGFACHDLTEWEMRHAYDPAAQGFRNDLKHHLLARLKKLDSADDEMQFTEAEKNEVAIKDNKLYQHKRLQLNFTTYDLERETESIGPATTKSDIMLLARDRATAESVDRPFWYARVIAIFHVLAHLRNEPNSVPTRVDFLWVRWFGRSAEDRFGDDACKLERIRFVTEEDGTSPFGFIDPGAIVRSIHLIPAFRYGRTRQLLRASALARVKDPDGTVEDWESYYVNKFADRDLFMLFRGGGIGHTWMHNTSQADDVPEDLYSQLQLWEIDANNEVSDESDGDEQQEIYETNETVEPGHDDEIVDAADYSESDWEDEDETEYGMDID